MSKYNPIYYLLIVLLIMGSFASMAQNDYGIKLLGIVSALFSLLFIIQLLQLLIKKSNQKMDELELIGLILLSLILAMRVFYIHFDFVEMVFGLAGLVLITVYCIKLLQSWKTVREQNRKLALLVVAFYGSIVLYFSSMISVAFAPQMADVMGGMAFGLLLLFAGYAIVAKDFLLDGERVSAFGYVLKLKDRSVVLLILFVLFTAYMGLTKINVLPKLYTDEYPQAYFELVNKAESGEEKPLNGTYTHEEFKELYDQFVSRH